jgi:hypothetical protein
LFGRFDSTVAEATKPCGQRRQSGKEREKHRGKRSFDRSADARGDRCQGEHDGHGQTEKRRRRGSAFAGRRRSRLAGVEKYGRGRRRRAGGESSGHGRFSGLGHLPR